MSGFWCVSNDENSSLSEAVNEIQRGRGPRTLKINYLINQCKISSFRDWCIIFFTYYSTTRLFPLSSRTHGHTTA